MLGKPLEALLLCILGLIDLPKNVVEGSESTEFQHCWLLRAPTHWENLGWKGAVVGELCFGGENQTLDPYSFCQTYGCPWWIFWYKMGSGLLEPYLHARSTASVDSQPSCLQLREHILSNYFTSWSFS